MVRVRPRRLVLGAWAILVAIAAGGPRLCGQEKPATRPASAVQPAEPAVIYTQSNPPPTPALERLPRRERIERHGITWTFEKPAPVGRFVNGDWYVVGPVTVTAIDPAPLFGNEVTNVTDVERKKSKEIGEEYRRNGSVVNRGTGGFDSRSRLYRPEHVCRAPLSLKPGDALVSSISLPRFIGNSTSIDTVSILTCLKEPVPADAFRPGYMDREQTIYLARDLRRQLLPRLAPPKGEKDEDVKLPNLRDLAGRLARPWMEMCFGYMQDQTSYQYDGYGRAVDQAIANASFLLCLDREPQEKEPLLRNLVQHGIDLYGILKSGHRGWPALGGWGSGRKWPIVFCGLLLGDDRMANINRTFPLAQFQEDLMTRHDDCWTGAGVVYCGHIGWVRREQGSIPYGWGPYENVHPSRWTGWIGTSYRTNMTSSTWIGSALLVRIFRAEKEWGHDAFLDYCDRWMYEPDSGVRNPTRISVQGHGYDLFAEAMWKTYRQKLPAIPGRDPSQRPTTGWQKKRELKGPEVAVGKNRQLMVQGKPMLPIMVFAEHPGRIDDAEAIGANVLAEGIFEKADNFHAFWMLNMHDETLVRDRLARDSRKGLIVGTNIAVATQNDGFLDALAAKGLYGVFGADARAIGHPALLGWLHVDEPDGIAAKAAGMTDKQLQEFNQGYRCMKFVKGAATTGDWYGPRPAITDVPDHLLLVQPAYEWMKKMDKGRPVFLTVGEAFLKAAAEGKRDLCRDYLANCDAVGCAVYPIATLGAGFRMDAAFVSTLAELAPGKPVIAWIDTRDAGAPAAAGTAPASQPAGRFAPLGLEAQALPVTPELVRAQVWMAIIGGATGVGYRGFEGLDLKVKPDAEVMAELKTINARLAALAPWILAAPARARVAIPAGEISCRSKATELDGVTCIFAQSCRGRGKATLKVAGLKAGTKIEVVDEGRTLTADEGQFTDEFAPLAEHVYKVRL